MADEMRFHVDMQTEQLMRDGVPSGEARRMALASFGGAARWQEAAREELRPVHVEDFVRDFRYALRSLRRNAAFAGVSIAILAIGIGASTTVFRFADALLLQPPPVKAPGELLEVWNADPRATSDFERYSPLSYPEYAYFRDHRGAFNDVLALDGDPAFLSWKRGDGGQLVQAQFVSENFFSLLGVTPSAGRLFAATGIEGPADEFVAVVSDAFWRTRLGADPHVPGMSLTVNGQPFTIVGVAPRNFTGIVAGLTPELWLPLATVERVKHEADLLASRNSFWLIVAGRLKPGATAVQARAELGAQQHQFADGDPELNGLRPTVFPATLVPGPFRGYVAAFLGLLQVLVVLMLVIACANAANLSLAQATSRRGEMAVRTSLGASRGRLMQQLLTESLLLAGLAGLAGMVVADAITPLMLSLLPPTLPVHLTVSRDWRVFVFTAALALAAGLALGWIPARRATADLMPALKGDALRGGRTSRLRNTLVVVQVSVSLVLLVAGALCWRSLSYARAVNPGFQTDHRVFAKLDLKSLDYSDSAGRVFYGALVDRLASAPGVTSVSTTSYLPLETTSLSAQIDVPGRMTPAGRSGFTIQLFDVGPGYFETAGTPMLRGREFRPGDTPNSSGVVVVNEAMATRFWPHDNAVGQTIGMGQGADRREYEVVGVVSTGKYRTLGEAPHPVLFRALWQHYQPRQVVLVHSTAAPLAALAQMREAVARLDPNLALIQANALDDQMALARFPARVSGILLTVVGVIGLALALTGLAALVAYSVAHRTKEIGIRMALGAQRRDVQMQIVGESARLLAIGIAIGAAAAFGLTRFLSSVLFGISANDPVTLIGVMAVLAGCALISCWLTARRAAAIDPLIAIRHE